MYSCFRPEGMIQQYLPWPVVYQTCHQSTFCCIAPPFMSPDLKIQCHSCPRAWTVVQCSRMKGPVNHALPSMPVSALIGLILDNGHMASLTYQANCVWCIQLPQNTKPAPENECKHRVPTWTNTSTSSFSLKLFRPQLFTWIVLRYFVLAYSCSRPLRNYLLKLHMKKLMS